MAMALAHHGLLLAPVPLGQQLCYFFQVLLVLGLDLALIQSSDRTSVTK